MQAACLWNKRDLKKNDLRVSEALTTSQRVALVRIQCWQNEHSCPIEYPVRSRVVLDSPFPPFHEFLASIDTVRRSAYLVCPD